MALRFPCLPVTLSAGGILLTRWGRRGFFRPALDLYAIGSAGVPAPVQAAIDTGADYVVLKSSVAAQLGVSTASLRHQPAGGAGGHTMPLLFAPPGQVALFLTDYQEYCYLADPLVGFHSPALAVQQQRPALGLTGFLEYFRFTLDHASARPTFELEPLPLAGVYAGTLPLGRPLDDFIRQLHAAS
jgi:hypothetical protein